jgi:hypothetical protein
MCSLVCVYHRFGAVYWLRLLKAFDLKINKCIILERFISRKTWVKTRYFNESRDKLVRVKCGTCHRGNEGPQVVDA